jgi:molybdate transport system substrate-binding protein
MRSSTVWDDTEEMPRYLALPFLALALVLGAGCGGGADRPRLTVSAAASLTEALTACSRDVRGADVRLSFAGSDELAAQIRQGVKPDVFAAANTTLPAELAAEDLVEPPVTFATNELVLAVPAHDARVDSLAELGSAGVRLAIGSETVPIGAYTRTVLGRLGAGDAILANVRSTEPDVRGIVGKLTQGAVDAGFVYRSDVEATKGTLRAIALPEAVRPRVAYAAAVVTGAREPELARTYVEGLRAGPCADALRAAGFGPPPPSS